MDLRIMIDSLAQMAVPFALKLVSAILVLAIGLKLSSFFVKSLGKSRGFQKIDKSVYTFLLSAIKIVLYILVIICTASILGIPATSFITILASAGVAIGLALQGSLSNIAGSIMILIFRPFTVGDFVEVNGISGTVESISLFYTVVLTPDNKVITCPNGAVSNGVITNYSTKDTRRVDITFSASYENDIDKVKSVIKSCVDAQRAVLSVPEPFIGVVSHNQNSVDYVCRVWVNSADYWDVYFSLMESVKAEFDKNGIEIPYPQMDVHVKNK